jgi:hypothetical protein
MGGRWTGFGLALEEAISGFTAGLVKGYVWSIHTSQVKRRSKGCPAFPFVKELGSRTRFGFYGYIVDDGTSKTDIVEVAHADGPRAKTGGEGALGVLDFVGVLEPTVWLPLRTLLFSFVFE